MKEEQSISNNNDDDDDAMTLTIMMIMIILEIVEILFSFLTKMIKEIMQTNETYSPATYKESSACFDVPKR